jgi:V8-like Glu-specific endopeptidase
VEALEDRCVPTNTIVNNTTSFPYSGAGRVTAVWDVNRNGRIDNSDGYSNGSGAMVSRSHVLTAAHVIYDTDPKTSYSGWPNWVYFAAGKTGNSEPFGRVYGTRASIAPGYPSNRNADLGIVTLNQSLGSRTGSFNYGYLSDSFIRPGNTVHTIHYPGSEPGFNGQGKQWYSYGPISSRDSQTFSYRKSDIRAVPGSSGAPVYVRNVTVNGRFYDRLIVGVNVRGTEGSWGTATSIRLNKSLFDWIGSKLRSNSNTASSALGQGSANLRTTQTGPVGGLPPAVFSQPTGLLAPPQGVAQSQPGAAVNTSGQAAPAQQAEVRQLTANQALVSLTKAREPELKDPALLDRAILAVITASEKETR